MLYINNFNEPFDLVEFIRKNLVKYGENIIKETKLPIYSYVDMNDDVLEAIISYKTDKYFGLYYITKNKAVYSTIKDVNDFTLIKNVIFNNKCKSYLRRIKIEKIIREVELYDVNFNLIENNFKTKFN